MPPDKRKPPDGHGRLSWNSVAADGFDFPRDNPTGPTKQVPAAPLDFDPAAYPILAQHWFNLRPEVAAQSTPDGNPRFQEARAA